MYKILSLTTLKDAYLVGNKVAYLGEAYHRLSPLNRLDGFVIDTEQIDEIFGLKTLREKFKSGEEISLSEIRAKTPIVLFEVANWEKVIIRSSSPLEDGDESAYAGAFESVVTTGKADLTSEITKVVQSLFSDIALDSGIGQMAVLIQEYIDDQEFSGVTFTQNPDTGEDHIVTTIHDGPCSDITSGLVSAPEVITEKYKALGIERICRDLELYFKKPLDVEWTKKNGLFYVLQVRPLTGIIKGDAETPSAIYGIPALLKGVGVSNKQVCGEVVKLQAPDKEKARGKIIVVENTSPQWMPVLKECLGVITDFGCRTCHTAIATRELGKTAVVGTTNGTKKLEDGDHVVLDGYRGRVYLQ